MKTSNVAVALALALLAGCASSGGGSQRAGRAATTRPTQDLFIVEHIVYRSGRSRVSALAAVPKIANQRGCLIWQSGLPSSKEDSALVWPGAAQLGLATFSIDMRLHGVPLSPAQQQPLAQDPAALAAMVRGTAAALRDGAAYLHDQPYCRGKVAYAGVSMGGIIGALVAARNPAVDAAVLMSTPATFASLVPSRHFLTSLRHEPNQLKRALRVVAPLDPERYVGRIAPRPLLLLNGIHDPIVPQSSARALQAAAREPKAIVNYDGGHNPFAGAVGASNAKVVSSFLRRDFIDVNGPP